MSRNRATQRNVLKRPAERALEYFFETKQDPDTPSGLAVVRDNEGLPILRKDIVRRDELFHVLEWFKRTEKRNSILKQFWRWLWSRQVVNQDPHAVAAVKLKPEAPAPRKKFDAAGNVVDG